MASKGRIYPRGSSRKSSSLSTIIFAVLIICSFFAFGFVILSIPKSSSDSSNVHEVNSIVQHNSIVDRNENVGDRIDQWVEVISWEPRAVVYHNLLATYKWDRTIDHRVKKLFNRIGGKSFRDFMCKARKKPEVKPKFINLSTWQELCRKTRLLEFIVKSNRRKFARQANKRLHTGGSFSIVEHQRRLQDELGREPFAGETFSRTHRHKDDTFVDDEARETWESYNEKHGVDDSRDAQSGNVLNSYTRWANHVGIKNRSFYGGGSGVDGYILQGSNMNESSTSASNNQNWNHVQDRVEQQESEMALIREEQARLRDTQEAQSEKLDQVLQFQSSFEVTLGSIIARKVRKVVAKEVKRVISQEVGKVISQEVGKLVSQEVGKANRQFLDGLQRRH